MKLKIGTLRKVEKFYLALFFAYLSLVILGWTKAIGENTALGYCNIIFIIAFITFVFDKIFALVKNDN